MGDTSIRFAALACLVAACGTAQSSIGPEPSRDGDQRIEDGGPRDLADAFTPPDQHDGATPSSPADASSPDGGTSPTPKPGGGATHTLSCNKPLGNGTYAAELLFPGRTMQELSKVRMLALVPSPLQSSLQGYTYQTTTFAVRDGAIAYYCHTRNTETVIVYEPDTW